MPGVYDAIDLRWTWNGDYDVGHSGDLKDTSDDYLMSLLQDIHNVCASNPRDWELYPGLGAGLDDFVGEPNVRSRANMIHDRLRLALTDSNIIKEDDIQIKVVPVHRHKVLIIIGLSVAATQYNGLSNYTNKIRTAFVFDFVEQGMVFWNKIPQLLAT